MAATLALAQSDMRNLLNCTDIATLFLYKELNVRRFTEKARKIIALRDRDIGRPPSDLTSQLEYPDLQADVQEMLRTRVASERQISRDGRWYAVHVMPYRTQDDVIQGAVITFVNITVCVHGPGNSAPPPWLASGVRRDADPSACLRTCPSGTRKRTPHGSCLD